MAYCMAMPGHDPFRKYSSWWWFAEGTYLQNSSHWPRSKSLNKQHIGCWRMPQAVFYSIIKCGWCWFTGNAARIFNSALSSGLRCSVKCIDRTVLSFPHLSIVFPVLVGDCSESYRSYWLSRKCIDLKTEVIEGSIVNCDGWFTISLFPFPWLFSFLPAVQFNIINMEHGVDLSQRYSRIDVRIHVLESLSKHSLDQVGSPYVSSKKAVSSKPSWEELFPSKCIKPKSQNHLHKCK